MSKVLFLVADGMAGWPLETLGHRTTLEAAHTPTIDSLAVSSLCGCCQTVPTGMPPGSDVANMALLGYDPRRYHTGRGPIEAAAQGLRLAPDDLVWRMNLVTISDLAPGGIMQDYSSGHITTQTAAPLLARLAELAQGSVFTPVSGVQYRHLLVQKNGATTPAIDTAIRPPHDILDQSIDSDLHAFATIPELEAFMRQAHAFLNAERSSQATSIWPWGQGSPLDLPDFTARHGRRGAVVSAVDLVKGLGRAAGMDVLEVEGANGLIDTNYDGKVQAALNYLQTGDFVYVHVEAPDECGHMGKPELKRRAIELFDQRIVAPIVAAVRDIDATIVVTCDHFTPVIRRTHTEDPVPFLIYRTRDAHAAGPATFTERTAAATGLILTKGEDMIGMAFGVKR